jgi:hypothetical protein
MAAPCRKSRRAMGRFIPRSESFFFLVTQNALRKPAQTLAKSGAKANGFGQTVAHNFCERFATTKALI